MSNEQLKTQRQLAIELNKWLAENNARLLVRLMTPRGEVISPENFVPPGWPLMVDVVPNNEVKQ